MKPFDILLYVLVVIGWSTSWLPLKWQVGDIAPEVSLVWRFVIAGSLLMVITRLSGRRLALPLWGHGVALTIGLFLFSTNYFFFYTGALVLPSPVTTGAPMVLSAPTPVPTVTAGLPA